jgi:hypothetical protein
MRKLDTGDAVIDFLRSEAPLEYERLQSIARLVASERGQIQSRPAPRDSSYPAWLQATFGIFGPRMGIEGRSEPAWV